MKKLLLAFGFCVFALSTSTAEAGVINYWDYWQSHASSKVDTSNASRYITPRYSTRANTRTSTTPRATSSQITTSTSSSSAWLNYLRSKGRGRTMTTSSNVSSVNTASTAQAGVRASVTPIRLTKEINDITAAPVNLFRIGLSNNASRGSDYSEAVYIDEMRFQITDNTGVVSNFADFSLVTEDQEFDFDSRGFVTLRFNNLRLARSEDRALDIAIKIEDPDSFPRLPGSFRVKLTEVTAYKEFSKTKVEVATSGQTASNYVVLNPRGSVSGGGTSIANITGSQTIAGRALGGSEKAFVLSMSLYASYDDFWLEKLTVTNQFGNNADKLVAQANLVDLSTGAVLDSTRFIGGKAVFDLPNNRQLLIGRNTRAKLGVEVQIVSSPNVDNLDNRLNLLVTANDIELFGIGAGRPVPGSQKNVDLDSETFTVARGTLAAQGGIYFSSNQPDFFVTGSLYSIARFKIVNAGSSEVSFARFSLQIIPNGVEFVSGGAADVQLVRLINGQTEQNAFTTTSLSGNVAVFDANDEIYVSPGETVEFSVKAALNDIGGVSDSDGVSLVILGDSSLQKGTLAAVRASGAQFIWSDHSGRPHVPGSADWFSGYQFTGVPTNAIVNTRR